MTKEREAEIRAHSDFYSYDPEDGFHEHSSAEAARSGAEESLDCYRDDAGDGWSEAVAEVQWGRLMTLGHAHECDVVHPGDEGFALDASEVDYQCDYKLHPSADPLAEALAELDETRVELAAAEHRVRAAVIADLKAMVALAEPVTITLFPAAPDFVYADSIRNLIETLEAANG